VLEGKAAHCVDRAAAGDERFDRALNRAVEEKDSDGCRLRLAGTGRVDFFGETFENDALTHDEMLLEKKE